MSSDCILNFLFKPVTVVASLLWRNQRLLAGEMRQRCDVSTSVGATRYSIWPVFFTTIYQLISASPFSYASHWSNRSTAAFQLEMVPHSGSTPSEFTSGIHLHSGIHPYRDLERRIATIWRRRQCDWWDFSTPFSASKTYVGSLHPSIVISMENHCIALVNWSTSPYAVIWKWFAMQSDKQLVVNSLHLCLYLQTVWSIHIGSLCIQIWRPDRAPTLHP